VFIVVSFLVGVGWLCYRAILACLTASRFASETMMVTTPQSARVAAKTDSHCRALSSRLVLFIVVGFLVFGLNLPYSDNIPPVV